MAMALRDALQETFSGWPDTVPLSWRSYAAGVTLAYDAQASEAGTSAQVAFVRADHPVVKTFLTEPNSLTEINVKLRGLGETPIGWTPA